MIPKLRKQIFDLERRGYRRSDMIIRLTETALTYLELELRAYRQNSVPQTKHPSSFEGVNLVPIHGVLRTIYVMAPFMNARCHLDSEGRQFISLVDADTRLLDEQAVQVGDQLVHFEPEMIHRTGQGRMDMTGRLLSVRKVTV